MYHFPLVLLDFDRFSKSVTLETPLIRVLILSFLLKVSSDLRGLKRDEVLKKEI